MNIETHLLPPNAEEPGPHILGQDSWYKGSRLADAWWDPANGVWHMFGFRYSARETMSNQWVYVAPGTLSDQGITPESETIVRIPEDELHTHRG